MRKRGPAVRRKLQYQGGWLQLHGKKFPKAWLGHWSIYDGYGSRHRRSAVIGREDEMTEKEARIKLRKIIVEEQSLSGAAYACGLSGRAKVELGDRTLKAGHLGAIAELIVAADLMHKGYDVYRPLSPMASCDLLGIYDQDIIRIEVKRAEVSEDGRANCDVRRNAGKFDLLAIVATSGEIHYVKNFLIDNFKRPAIRRANVPEKSDPIDPNQTELKSDVIDSTGVQ